MVKAKVNEEKLYENRNTKYQKENDV